LTWVDLWWIEWSRWQSGVQNVVCPSMSPWTLRNGTELPCIPTLWQEETDILPLPIISGTMSQVCKMQSLREHVGVMVIVQSCLWETPGSELG
jgi:hypothetical protein